jgi:DNA polymerase-1
VTRYEAKTINFMLLYGGGVSKLAEALKCREWDAKQKRKKYFSTLRGVSKFVGQVQEVAKKRGYIISWLGRLSYFPDPEHAYKAPNSLIQGGTADVVKLALNRCCEHLRGKLSAPLLQVHDELVFELHKSELHLAPELLRIMETVFPHKYIGLTCTPEHSWKSLADKVEGYPGGF